eukprot:scaffold124979_cov41-Cyclotella_meneghiniana.AAC.3
MLKRITNKRQNPKFVRQATIGEYEYKKAFQNTQDRQLIKIERSCESNDSIGIQNKAITTSSRYHRQGPDKQVASKKRARVSCRALILEVRGQTSGDNYKAAIRKID